MYMRAVLFQLLFPAMLVGMGILSTSCRGDDGNSEIPSIPATPTDSINTSKPEEKPFVGVTYFEDNVKIQLQLLNPDSIATDTFKEGEDIIFKLTITNISNELVMTTRIHEFSDNIFNIYSSSGVEMGKPWDGRYIALTHSFLTPGMSQEYICSWLEKPVEDVETIIIEEWSFMSIARSPIHYYKIEQRQPLAKGSYYTLFDVSVIESRKTRIRMDFNVE